MNGINSENVVSAVTQHLCVYTSCAWAAQRVQFELSDWRSCMCKLACPRIMWCHLIASMVDQSEGSL